MSYFPAFLNVSGRRCLVVGGGEVGARKVIQLLDAEADVTVVSPDLAPPLAELKAEGRISHLPRRYRRGDLDGAFLVCAAAGDSRAHRQISRDAERRGVLVNVADEPDLCSFIAPATLRRGRVQIAISTGGASPALAARLRRDLELYVGAEYGVGAEILAAARAWLKEREPDERRRADILIALACSDLFDCIRLGDLGRVDQAIMACLGDGVGLDALGLAELRLDAPESGETHP